MTWTATKYEIAQRLCITLSDCESCEVLLEEIHRQDVVLAEIRRHAEALASTYCLAVSAADRGKAILSLTKEED